uniref:NADH-ubiquinone oxidoreductase chain 6 n=1 Tax=Amazonina sp. Z256E TaxID=2093491 RepID=A0A2P1HA03_9NEOP|nr:NADH dehydrogenase subunit 6 [Amazonina sp. Z256E]
MLMSFSIMLSILFSQTNHPLALGLILLSQTITISILLGMIHHSFWFSYILFLVFLGGMLVLFIYVTSLASNEMLSISINIIIFPLILLTMFIVLTHFNFPYENQETINTLSMKNLTTNSIMKLYNQPTNTITIMMASYLFLSLIAVVKIINIFKGPLRKTN